MEQPHNLKNRADHFTTDQNSTDNSAPHLSIHRHFVVKVHYFFSLQRQFTENFVFRLDSVVPTVKDVEQKFTLSSEEFPLSTCKVLSFRIKTFLVNHLAQIPITLAGAQDVATSGYELSDLDDVEIFWKKHSTLLLENFFRKKTNTHVDADFGPVLDNNFSPTTSNNMEMGISEKNRLCYLKRNTKGTFVQQLYLLQQFNYQCILMNLQVFWKLLFWNQTSTSLCS